MMKQPIWKLSACAFALLLNACASNKAYENLPINVSSSAASQTTTSATANTNTFRGVVAQRSRNSQAQRNSDVIHFNISGSNLNAVSVDGNVINLNSNNQSQRFNNALSYTKFGLAQIPSQRQNELVHSYYLAYGQTTPASSMPTTGVATYQGTAINSLNALERPATFNVNYGTKQINGDIDKQLFLNAEIIGATFSGSKDGIRMNGRFFGPNAEELGGTYSSISNPDGVVGSFGARKR